MPQNLQNATGRVPRRDRTVLLPAVKKISIIVYAVALAAVVAWIAIEIEASFHSSGNAVVVRLARGPFTLLEFPSKAPATRAIIIFGSGPTRGI